MVHWDLRSGIGKSGTGTYICSISSPGYVSQDFYSPFSCTPFLSMRSAKIRSLSSNVNRSLLNTSMSDSTDDIYRIAVLQIILILILCWTLLWGIFTDKTVIVANIFVKCMCSTFPCSILYLRALSQWHTHSFTMAHFAIIRNSTLSCDSAPGIARRLASTYRWLVMPGTTLAVRYLACKRLLCWSWVIF